jgi:hypothetical protein
MTEDEADLLRELRCGPADDRVAMARLLREASGTSVADWVMSEIGERTAAWLGGLFRLVRAAGASLFAYFDAAPWSRARSDVLLAGAEALGIATDWVGWPA